MRMCNFWAQNGPFPQRIFSENMLMSLFSLIHAYLHAKNQSQILIVKCWLLKNTEISLAESHFLAITWEPDFSQACSFCRMLMNHKKFHFTQIPEKTNDMIFLKSPKTTFLGHFCQMRIFSKKSSSVTHNYIWASNTILCFRKN